MFAWQNFALKRGGAIHNVYSTHFHVSDSEFSDNYGAQYGGAIFERDNSGVTYYDRLSFHRNRAGDGHIMSGFGVTQYFRQCTAYLSGNVNERCADVGPSARSPSSKAHP